jgi:energy-coupling factor transport system substrate-specific component
MEEAMRIKDIALIGIMSAILVAVQVTLGFLPNIELVSLLIIIYTLVFGKKTLYIIYVFVALEGIIYGISLWWLNYLYIWTVLFTIVILLRKHQSTYFWAIISGFYGLIFGALCSIPNLFLSGIGSAVSYWISGIPFDILHGVGNFVVALLLFHPLYQVLNKINKKTVDMY